VVAGGRFSTPQINIAMTDSTIGVNELGDVIVNKTFFPNPVHGNAQLTVTTKERLKNPALQIFDLQSRLVQDAGIEMNFTDNKIEFRINCANLARGSYYYMLSE